MIIISIPREQDDDTDTPYVETVYRLDNRPSSVNDYSSSDDPVHEFLRMQPKA
jgi:inositol hexakisphosphate/diphosphoinositol-pentakisphosphate kinase